MNCVFFLNSKYKMSSTQRFLRQRTPGNTLLEATSGTQLYSFIAGPGATGSLANALVAQGNYVGNYPPGYLVPAVTIAQLQQGVQGGILAPVLRDMGKTIRASLSSDTAGTTLGTPGFWRAVQVLNPVTVASATAQTNFGVTGQAPGNRPTFNSGNVGDSGYNTYYIPIAVDGVAPGATAGGGAIVTLPILNYAVGDVL